MRKPETKTIGSYTYTVTMLPPRQAHRLLLRALKAAGPALAPVLTAAGGSVASVVAAVRAAGEATEGERTTAVGGALVKALGDDASWLERAVQKLVEALKEEELDFIIDTLAEQTQVSRGAAPLGMLTTNFDLVFGDDIKELYLWLWFAWVTQFSSFFGSLAKGLKT